MQADREITASKCLYLVVLEERWRFKSTSYVLQPRQQSFPDRLSDAKQT